MADEQVDLYEVLGISSGASQSEVKKAYHKAALASHPDKVPESEREAADTKFKLVSKAYEILYDDDKRHLYDTHGMSAFEAGAGPGAGGVDLDDILAQMMGGMGGMGGMPPGFGGRGRPNKPRKGKDEEQVYEVTLEELYKGKTVKFASTKNVICSHCKGSGGKEKAKPKECASCRGQGLKEALRSVGPGLVTRSTEICGNCHGKGKVYNPKDRCKKCSGEGTTKAKKTLELYIPRGSKSGEKIRLEGEADQVPDQEPGDLVFVLEQKEHDVFTRQGNDLRAILDVTLAEALCGFSRVVIKHLDGRGIKLDYPQSRDPRVLQPSDFIKIPGEGMPIKKTDSKGVLYLQVQIKMPEYQALKKTQAFDTLLKVLPGPEKAIETEEVDDVEYKEISLEEAANDLGQGDEGWEDDGNEDDEGMEGAQCQQQ